MKPLTKSELNRIDSVLVVLLDLANRAQASMDAYAHPSAMPSFRALRRSEAMKQLEEVTKVAESAYTLIKPDVAFSHQHADKTVVPQPSRPVDNEKWRNNNDIFSG